MTETQELLASYVRTGSEPAFRELLTRYVDLVYSAAVRLVGGDAYLAKDVVQRVFVDLARMARRLPVDVMLGGWLHRHTCFVASTVMRGERRRQFRERQAVEMNALQNEPDIYLQEVAPVLDEAINKLGNEDRTAILLRFFEQLDYRKVGEILGSSEGAAKKRVCRALDKLHGLLTARGVTLSAAALATGLTTSAIKGAPAGLVASLAGTAIASATATNGFGLALFKFMTTSKMSAGVAGAIIVAGALFAAREIRIEAALQEENNSLRRQREALTLETSRLSNQLSQAYSARTADDQKSRELMRLRGEVSTFKRELANARKAGERYAPPQIQTEAASQDESAKPMSRARDAKILGYAFHAYASSHDDQFPSDFAQAVPYIAEGLRSDLNPGDVMRDEDAFIAQVTNRFEIIYYGSPTNSPPEGVILLREKQPTQSASGSWIKAYCFVDGTGQIHEEADGNFEAWENKHMTAAGRSR